MLADDESAFRAPSPSAIISPACRKILCAVYPAADAPISTSVKLGEVPGVELVSICEAYTTTPLPVAQHFKYCRCPSARYLRYAFVSRFQHPPQITGNEANFSAG